MDDESPDTIRPLRLDGGRFERAQRGGSVGFPLSAIRELARYDDLVFEVAKRMWRAEHLAAGQVPRDFEEKVRLRLTAVEEGSVGAVMVPMRPTGEFDDGAVSYGDRARELVADALGSFLDDSLIVDEFPEDALDHLARIGKSLKDDEIAIFERSHGREVRYHRRDQKKLAKFISSTRPASGALLGMVTAIDPDGGSFVFCLPGGRKVAGKFAGETLEDAIMAVTGTRERAPYVALQCDYQIDAKNAVAAIDEARSVERLSGINDPLGQRLRELAELQRGWDGDGADPVSIDALRVAQQVANECQARGIPLPHAFLTLEGGVSLEEQPAATRWSLEIEPDGAMLIAVAGGDIVPRLEEPKTPTDAASSLKGFLA